MVNSYTVLANLKAGRCSNTVRVVRFKEAPNVKIGVELMSVDILFLKKLLHLRFSIIKTKTKHGSGIVQRFRFQAEDWS
ncbi:hypothetical protein Bca4012_093676 [Brassica carinata]|uniref:Uncharacterized protein n=1 Tax=Brassica carinata TaxID=52824 RepID=A0A8X7PST3_BRACI|nr:hypothetical protein Bca52824_075852 [Brassica carinata]